MSSIASTPVAPMPYQSRSGPTQSGKIAPPAAAMLSVRPMLAPRALGGVDSTTMVVDETFAAHHPRPTRMTPIVMSACSLENAVMPPPIASRTVPATRTR